ncbi:MAG TPA: hypothetical protein VK671_12080 [Mucilaginibacter sp.]|jgi:hypothetical protein|nr:hypothetical protein [Mucilaginibacter sp.]
MFEIDKYMSVEFYKELLNDFKFDDLYIELSQKSDKELQDILSQLACDPITDECNLLVYTFLCFLIAKGETSNLQLLTSTIMATSLNLIDKSEKIALYHGLRALEMDPDDINIMEYLLYFNHMPSRLLDNSLAIDFAKRILKENPNSMAARITLPPNLD